MDLAEELLTVTAENVYCFVTNVAIFKAYCDPKMRFNTSFSSPFRKDAKPSFVIYEKGFFVDFANGEKGNAITFVMKLHQVNFNTALLMIIKEFNLTSRFNCFDSQSVSVKKAAFENPKNSVCVEGGVEITVKKRPFNNHDKEYWSQYEITEQDLIWAKVVPVSHYFLDGRMFIAEKLSYAFLEKKDKKLSVKIYQPMSSYLKWINSNDSSVWELWEQLPKTGTHVIITSSRKDAICIYKHTGIPSTSFQSETIIPKSIVMEEVFSRFDNVFLLMDNDVDKEKNWGQEAASKLKSKYPELINVVIPEKSKCKDFSDLISMYGFEKSSIALKRLILQEEKNQALSYIKENR
jgi:hypothetical protein